jgi:hypothetical protein
MMLVSDSVDAHSTSNNKPTTPTTTRTTWWTRDAMMTPTKEPTNERAS